MISSFLVIRSALLATLILVGFAGEAQAHPVPPAIFTDPPTDHARPAAMTVLHVPSHGVLINGLLYSAAGAGPHPTLVLCHGLPGNEKNLDLAQAVRRAGWNAVTFNYRGSWGSPGSFRFRQNLEDADAVLGYLREPANAAKLGIDSKRIVIAGHSMGGWVVAHTAAHDPSLRGAILISMADMGNLIGSMPRAKAVAEMADDMETLADVTPERMVDELTAHAKEFAVSGTAAGLAQIPVLAITANDSLGPQTDALVAAIKAKGGTVTAAHLDTDHSYSDKRIALESIVITWLSGLH